MHATRWAWPQSHATPAPVLASPFDTEHGTPAGTFRLQRPLAARASSPLSTATERRASLSPALRPCLPGQGLNELACVALARHSGASHRLPRVNTDSQKATTSQAWCPRAEQIWGIEGSFKSPEPETSAMPHMVRRTNVAPGCIMSARSGVPKILIRPWPVGKAALRARRPAYLKYQGASQKRARRRAPGPDGCGPSSVSGTTERGVVEWSTRCENVRSPD